MRWDGVLVRVISLAIALIVLGLPAAGVAVDVARGIGVDPGAFELLGGDAFASIVRTFLYGTGIGVLATALGAPVGARGARSGLSWVLASAVLLAPSYLLFSGLSVLRAPGWFLGDWIVGAAQDGARWLPVFLSKAFAVVGLGLWAAPIAAGIVATSVRRADPAAVDAAAVYLGRIGRLRVWLGCTGGRWLHQSDWSPR